MPKIAIARSAAHAMLLAIEAGEGHSDDLLRNDPLMAAMSDADRRLTTALVLGVLRWQIQLDELMRTCLAKPNAKLDPAVLIALRLGAFQLLHLDRIPAHAAINDSVELTKRSGIRSAAGLVNAVLRKMAGGMHENGESQGSADQIVRNKSSKSASLPPPHGRRPVRGDPGRDTASQQVSASVEVSGKPLIVFDALAAVAAHPEWMVKRWARLSGFDKARDICVYDQCAAASAVRLAAPEIESELAGLGLSVVPGSLLTAARIVEFGDVRGTAAFQEGRVRFQDEGSQLIAEMASIAGEPERILDCCAAPGGKTLILAERNPSAHIVACEASRPRLKQLRGRLAGMGERVECRLADATALTFDSEFDLALADVPCSGTGTLGRNPEIRHRLRPDDLPRHAERQRAILKSALRAVRPGGRVVYSTCSLEPEENEEVIDAVLTESGDARVAALGPAVEQLRDRGIVTGQGVERLYPCLTYEGFLRLIPGQFGTDGFFVAMMERKTGSAM